MAGIRTLPPALYCKSVAFKIMGRYDETMLYYDKLAELNPNDAEARGDKENALEEIGRYADTGPGPDNCQNK